MRTALLLCFIILRIVNSHIIKLDRDFSKAKSEQDLAKYVQEVIDRLNTFKVPVHPRIRLFYELLKKAMTNYSHRTADSLYIPDKYNKVN
ncbi:hypothetical protein K1T71_013780 [Dendrolimus kikuchii]|uniref:Uncharacterized protein n=1 Tax=Dendrolimus kikuchii TaxID=765133 RepID=A0ACC1CG04_9NEOP|nr:hypothetical protein K1T71_013780 [Dendrolimus kikuchii]